MTSPPSLRSCGPSTTFANPFSFPLLCPHTSVVLPPFLRPSLPSVCTQACGAPMTAVLFVELWCERTYGCLTLGDGQGSEDAFDDEDMVGGTRISANAITEACKSIVKV